MSTPAHAATGKRSLRIARLIAASIAVAIGVMLSLVVEQFHRLEVEADRDAAQREILVRAAAVRARLEAEISASLFISDGTAELVSTYQDLLAPERIMTVLELIHRSGRHLRNVALAPDNVIRYIYPVDGNEAALGLDYATTDQWPGVERAIAEARTVVTGPEVLAQGGSALIVRTPILLGDGSYWGMLSAVVDSDSLLEAIGRFGPDAGVRIAVRRILANGRSRRVLGDDEVWAENPMVLNVSVPGAEWQLGAAPLAGWSGVDPHRQMLRIGGHLLVLLVAFLSYLVLDDRARAASAALHDPLTRLPNRRQLRRRLKRELQRCERSGDGIAVLYVDLNGFKPINDRLGHGVGDRVLASIAERLDATCDRQDFLARIGGDEFVALTLRVDRAEDLARSLEQAVLSAAADAEDVVAAGLRLGASVGIARYPEDGSSIIDLLQKADQRMYRQKEGRSQPQG